MEREVVFPLLEGRVAKIISNSAALEICLFFPFIFLFSNLFIAVQIHGYLFYILGYNPILPLPPFLPLSFILFLSFAEIIPGLAMGELFHLTSTTILHFPLLYVFFSLF